MHIPNATKLIAACALTLWASTAFGHIVLETKAAQVGTDYQAAFMVEHGCAGSPTNTVDVQIPAGFEGALPVAKPGWSVAVGRSKLVKPYVSNGKSISEDVTRITWTATGKEFALPEGKREKFEMTGKLAAAPGPLWFKVLQGCETGSNNWVQIPSMGTSTSGLKNPAAFLNVAAGPVAAVAPAQPVQVAGAWVRSTVPGQKGTGAFMQITARQGLRLVGVTSPLAAVSEVHEMKMEGDVMRMRQISGVDLPAGVAVELKPGGYHVMLLDLKQPVLPNSTVPLTLLFKDARGVESKLDLSVTASASAPSESGKPAGKADAASDHKH